MSRRSWSLRWLIGGTYFVIMVLTLSTLALYFIQRTEDQYMTTLGRTLRGQALLGARLLAPALQDSAQMKEFLGWIRVTSDARSVQLLNLDGSIIAAEATTIPETPVLPPEARMALNQYYGEDTRLNVETDEDTLYVAVLVKQKSAIGQGKAEAILVLAKPLTEVQVEIGSIKAGIALAFAGVIIILFFIYAGVSNYISQPLAVLSTAAERFADGHLHERVNPTGAMEIASLGESFNRMAEQLRSTITGLATERAQVEAMLISMVDGVVVTDTQQRILLMNHSAEQLLNISATQAIGKTLTETILHFEFHDFLEKTLASGLPLKQELNFTQPVERDIEIHMAPVMVDTTALGVVIVLYDATQQRKVQRMHKDFVANVSHELRTPVASIRAMAETLAEIGISDPEMLAEFLATIIGESERLSSLLDDLLQISRLEAGHRLITPEPLDLCEVIRHVARHLEPLINAKEQRLLLELPHALHMPADHDALVQILVNLIGNAYKYSPEGATITVRVQQIDALALFSVADNGIGIAAAEHERIFERFYRVDKARSRAQGGTGLGLSIVKQLVELHGGHITVDSDIGIGSTLTVQLPCQLSGGEAGVLPAIRSASRSSSDESVE